MEQMSTDLYAYRITDGAQETPSSVVVYHRARLSAAVFTEMVLSVIPEAVASHLVERSSAAPHDPSAAVQPMVHLHMCLLDVCRALVKRHGFLMLPAPIAEVSLPPRVNLNDPAARAALPAWTHSDDAPDPY